MIEKNNHTYAHKISDNSPQSKRQKLDKIIKTVALVFVVLTLVGTFVIMKTFSSSETYDVSSKGVNLFGDYKSYQNNVYVAIPSDGYYRVPEADLATFQAIERSRLFAKDANHVYCANQILSKLSPKDTLQTYNYYISNGQVTYFCSNAKRNLAIGWFQTLFGDHDEHSLNKVPMYYHEIVEVQDILSDHLKYLIGFYLTDGKSIFYNGKKLEDANGASAELVKYDLFEVKGRENSNYIKDDKNVYYHDVKIPTDRSFVTFRPFDTQWADEYGVDSKRYYFKGVPFPEKADGYDATKLSILMADRAHANHELFYNQESLFFYDYRKEALTYLCENSFSGEIHTLSSGVYHDDKALYIVVPVEVWTRKRGLLAKETHLYKVDHFDGTKLEKVEDIKKWHGGPLGSLYKKGSEYFFVPSLGQFHGYYAPIYAIENPKILKLSAQDEKKWRRYESDSLMELSAKLMCKASSQYRTLF